MTEFFQMTESRISGTRYWPAGGTHAAESRSRAAEFFFGRGAESPLTGASGAFRDGPLPRFVKIRSFLRTMLLALSGAGLIAVGSWWLTPRAEQTGARPVSAAEDPAAAAPQIPVEPPPPARQARRATVPPATLATSAASVPARENFASAWRNEANPTIAEFNAWAENFLAVPAAARAARVADGVARAQARRAVLRELIVRDPRQAIAAAVPLGVRAQLPAEVAALLEERISGTGRLALLGATPVLGETLAEPVFRTATVGTKTYRAYVYGRREAQATKVDISLLGVALDGAAAISESPLRVLEPGERPAPGQAVETVCPISGDRTPLVAAGPLNTAGLRAVEAGGRIYVLCASGHAAHWENRLIRAEDAAGPYAGARAAALTAANDQPGTSGISNRPPLAWSTGTKKVLLIRVDFSDKIGTPINTSDSQPITPAYAANVFNVANGITDFYAQASFGQTALAISAADVTAVYRLPQTAAYYAQGDGVSGYDDTLHTDARALATAGGFNLALYDRIGVVFSSLSAIASSKITYGGLGDIQGDRYWLNGSCNFRTIAHEIGHNYGVQHCNLWQVADGNPVSAAGTSTEYGDPFGVMSSASTDSKFHFDMWEKSILHWIPDTSVTTIAAAGTYRVYRFDHASANTANPLALKIVRNSAQDYWIGLRKLFPSNASLSNGAYILWGGNSVVQGNLLDCTTPGASAQDAALAAGATFHDTAAGVTIHPLATGGTSPNEYLDVQVSFDPHIQWAATTTSVDQLAGSVTLTVTRTLNSTGAVSVNYATANGTALAGTHYTTQSGTISWASGDSAAKTITIPLSAVPVFTGLKTFTVALSALAGGVLVNGATATVNIAAAGAGDPAFLPDFVNSTVTRAIVQPDGKLLLAGWFSAMQDANFTNYTRNGFGGLNANGTVDPTWGNGAGVNATPVYAAALQPDGKMLIAGNFTSVHGTARNRVARLNVDGSLDTTFNVGTGAGATVRALVLQPDGKIVVGGDFTTFAGSAREYLARLNVDGTLDSGFVGPDFAVTSGWRVHALALAPDGSAPFFKILVGGSFYFSGSPFKASLARITSTGALDSAFSTAVGHGAHAAGSTGSIRQINAIAVQRDGKIVIGGTFTAFNNVAHNYLARLAASGALDGTFTPTADADVSALLVQPDGKILVGGAFVNMNATALNHFARLTAGGTNDPAFGVGTGSTGQIYDLTMQPDGKVVLAGDFATIQGVAGVTLARLFTGLPGLPGTVQFSASALTGTEGNTLTVTATRTGGSYGAVSLNYGTQAGSAAATRYTAVSGTLAWLDGDAAAKTFAVPILNDGIAQADQTFTLNLGIPIGGVLAGAPGAAVVTVTTVYGQWKASHFTPAELLNPAVSGDLADPDGDSLGNLLEYGFATDPKVANAAGLSFAGAVVTQHGLPTTWIQNIANGVDYRALFGRRKDYAVAGLTYTVKFSGDLVTWASSTATPTVIASDAEIDAVTVPYPFFVNGRKARFFKVEVTIP